MLSVAITRKNSERRYMNSHITHSVPNLTKVTGVSVLAAQLVDPSRTAALGAQTQSRAGVDFASLMVAESLPEAISSEIQHSDPQGEEHQNSETEASKAGHPSDQPSSGDLPLRIIADSDEVPSEVQRKIGFEGITPYVRQRVASGLAPAEQSNSKHEAAHSDGSKPTNRLPNSHIDSSVSTTDSFISQRMTEQQLVHPIKSQPSRPEEPSNSNMKIDTSGQSTAASTSMNGSLNTNAETKVNAQQSSTSSSKNHISGSHENAPFATSTISQPAHIQSGIIPALPVPGSENVSVESQNVAKWPKASESRMVDPVSPATHQSHVPPSMLQAALRAGPDTQPIRTQAGISQIAPVQPSGNLAESKKGLPKVTHTSETSIPNPVSQTPYQPDASAKPVEKALQFSTQAQPADAQQASSTPSADSIRSQTAPHSTQTIQTSVKTNIKIPSSISTENVGSLLLQGELQEVLSSDVPRLTPTASTLTSPMRTDFKTHVIRQVVEVMAQAIHRPVEITLSPQELGRVRMSVHNDEGKITVNIIAERADTLDLMRRNID